MKLLKLLLKLRSVIKKYLDLLLKNILKLNIFLLNLKFFLFFN